MFFTMLLAPLLLYLVNSGRIRSIGIFFFLFFFLAVGNTCAESKDIQKIRQYYSRIASETTRCFLNAETGRLTRDCNLYLIEISDNKLDVPVCSVGTFKVLNQYWLDTSGFLDAANEHPAQCDESSLRQLVNVEINATSAAVDWYEQFIYRQGELVFYFIQSKLGEYRFYFKTGTLIRYSEAKGSKENTNHPSLMPKKRTWPDILRAAAHHQRLFLLTRQGGEENTPVEAGGLTHEGKDDQLCQLDERKIIIPDDLKIEEKELSVKRALERLGYVQQEVLDVLASYHKKNDLSNCRYPDCIGGVAWETLTIGTPNALATAKGTILKLNALYLRERAKNEDTETAKSDFVSASKAYCDFIATQTSVD